MTRSKTPEDGLCPDWIYSDSSNVHIAKDKAWFTSYHHLQSHLGSVYNIGTPNAVLGIGTVKLMVKSFPGSFTMYGSSTIELHNVLHVPSYFCNVLGRPLANMYQINFGGSVHEGGPSSRGGLSLNGRQVAHFQPGPISFFSLAVLPPQGTAFGLSPFKNGVSWAVSCYWPNQERQRWRAIQDQAARDWEPPRYESAYALHEAEHIDKNWGSEFRFLAQYRLKLHDERDRSEGRRIVRALMRGRNPQEKKKEIEVEGRLGSYLLPNRGMGGRQVRHASAPRVPFF